MTKVPSLRRALLGAAALLALAACAADKSECTLPGECPGTDGTCGVRTCTGGACGFSYAVTGTALPIQVPGDCRRAVCDGAGGVGSAIDDTDVPHDGSGCSACTCAGGASAGCIPLQAETPCGTGLRCDGAGACVECIGPASCPGLDTDCQDRTCAGGVCGFLRDDARCDDGLACTADACTLGVGGDYQCTHVASTTGCLVAGACYAAGAANPANPCQACAPGASTTAWTSRPAGTACGSGGGYCSLADGCDGAGACVAGPVKNCDDGLACTINSCDPSSGACLSAVAPGFCLIAGACYSDGAANPANACQACVSGMSTSSWMALPVGTPCAGGTCNGTGACVP